MPKFLLTYDLGKKHDEARAALEEDGWLYMAVSTTFVGTIDTKKTCDQLAREIETQLKALGCNPSAVLVAIYSDLALV